MFLSLTHSFVYLFLFLFLHISSPSLIHPVLDGNKFTRKQNKKDCYY